MQTGNRRRGRSLEFRWQPLFPVDNMNSRPECADRRDPAAQMSPVMRQVSSLGEARSSESAARRGAATIDYVLGLGVVLPLLLIVIPAARRAMQLVFELACTLVAWPFM